MLPKTDHGLEKLNAANYPFFSGKSFSTLKLNSKLGVAQNIIIKRLFLCDNDVSSFSLFTIILRFCLHKCLKQTMFSSNLNCN